MGLLAHLLFAGVAAGCGGDDATGPVEPDGLRVGAFDFAESELLAEMYAQTLEAKGIPVERIGVVGPREIVAPALQLDRIDLAPEYLGTAAAHYGAAEQDLDGLRAALEPLGLTAFRPAEAEDTNVVVVLAETARRHRLTAVSDLSGLASAGRFGGPVECPERPLCLLGLRETYGLDFAEFVPQRSLALTAEALRRGEIDVGLLFSTAAALEDESLVVLEDDRGLQPAENVVPVVRRAAVERFGPEVEQALNGLSDALTTTALRTLNGRVEDGEAIEAVASSWLADTSLTQG